MQKMGEILEQTVPTGKHIFIDDINKKISFPIKIKYEERYYFGLVGTMSFYVDTHHTDRLDSENATGSVSR